MHIIYLCKMHHGLGCSSYQNTLRLYSVGINCSIYHLRYWYVVK